MASAGPSKTVVGIVGIFLGSLGVHRFMLGDAMGGIIRLAITVCTCGAGGLIGVIEGVMYLTKSDEEFHQQYVVEKKAWF